MLLSLENVSISRGANTLIENVNFTVFEKNIIGFIGSNGCGKTSLFSAIQGNLNINAGKINYKKNLMMSHLEQETPALEIPAINYVISGDPVLFKILEDLDKYEALEKYEKVAELHSKLHQIDGYSAQSKAAKILTGLGFAQDELRKFVKYFSGGWRMRLNLAKCLFSQNDLLLLDEPTNHLDMETIFWLEGFLKNYSGAILMISHDQDFLDNTVTHIAHIENHCIKIYPGNYSSFEIQRAQQIEVQNSCYKKQQAHISHLQKFIDKFKAKASKAAQAQSRMKALSKMELVKPIYENLAFKFKFRKPKSILNPILSMRKVNLGYENKIIINNINLKMLSQQRIGLIGVNGAGKSTFIKALCGELNPLHGIIERPQNLVIGYFAQHQVDSLDLNSSCLDLIKELNSQLNNSNTEQELINFLASFGFARDQSLSPIQRFSGGEKARLALALLVWKRPNLLLLDEPTNHLDLEMRQALTMALEEYEGTIIMVSHDRHLMRALVDDLYIIDNGQLAHFDGTLEDYHSLIS